MSVEMLFLPLVTPLSRVFMYGPFAFAALLIMMAVIGLFLLAAAMPKPSNPYSDSNVISGNRIARQDPRIIQPRKYWTGD